MPEQEFTLGAVADVLGQLNFAIHLYGATAEFLEKVTPKLGRLREEIRDGHALDIGVARVLETMPRDERLHTLAQEAFVELVHFLEATPGFSTSVEPSCGG